MVRATTLAFLAATTCLSTRALAPESLAPFSKPPHPAAMPLEPADCAVLASARRAALGSHAIFAAELEPSPPAPQLVERCRDLLVACWHGVDRPELLSSAFAFSSPARVRGRVSLDAAAFRAACASLELRDALWAGATPAFYGFAADPLDAATVTFLVRGARDRAAPPRLGSMSFDAADRVTALTLGKPLVDAPTAERDAPPPPPPPRRGLATRVRALFAAP